MRPAALVIVAAACGAPADEAPALVAWIPPWNGAQSVSCSPSALAGMEATLYIGGQAPCALEVDPDTAAAAGSCQGIVGGVVRPLIVVYTLAAGAADVALAYVVGSIDLRDPDYAAGGSIVVTLGAESLYREQAAVDAIVVPGGDCRFVEPMPPEPWAKCFAEQTLGYDLDCADTGESNLDRACDGRLVCPQ